MRRIKLCDWMPDHGIELEENADRAVRLNESILVIAGPGSGKTELLAQKAMYLLQTNQCADPRKILALTFKRDAAENLKKRVEERCGVEAQSRLISKTYDAFCKQLLDHFRRALPEEFMPTPDYKIELCSSDETDGIHFVIGERIIVEGDNAGKEKLEERLHGPDGMDCSVLTHNLIKKLADLIIQTNPKIRRCLQLTYSHVFLDEFQDTTDLQYNFLKHCFHGSSAILTAVGDPRQSIMNWAGAKNSVIEEFCSDFAAQEISLKNNYRSVSRLVEFQREFAKLCEEETSGIYSPAAVAEGDGKISLHEYDTDDEEARAIAEDIQQKIISGIEINDICILCRKRPDKYVQKIMDRLKENGINARIENDYQRLTRNLFIELMLDFMACSLSSYPQEWGELKSKIEKMAGLSDVQEQFHYDRLNEDMIRLNHKMKEICVSNDPKTNEAALDEIRDALRRFIDQHSMNNSFLQDEQSDETESLFVEFKEKLMKELQDHDWALAIEHFRGKHSIPVMSIHKSKGLEFSVVYFIGLEDSAFLNFRETQQEECRTLFVAASRAKKALIFTYCKERRSVQPTPQSHEKIQKIYELIKSSCS